VGDARAFAMFVPFAFLPLQNFVVRKVFFSRVPSNSVSRALAGAKIAYCHQNARGVKARQSVEASVEQSSVSVAGQSPQ